MVLSGEVPTSVADSAPDLAVHVRNLADLDGDDLGRWERLARRSVEPNPFQEPEFVLPLANSIIRDHELLLVVVQDVIAGDWGYANVLDRPPAAGNPLRHLRSLLSAYSFLDHPLIDRDLVDSALQALFKSMSSEGRWHGIRFSRLTLDTWLGEALARSADASGVTFRVDRDWSRSVRAVDRHFSAERLLKEFSKSRRKSLRRAWNWLQSRGTVRYRILSPTRGNHGPAEEFLRLETLGWKGEAGTSLASNHSDRRFFLEMVDAFAKSRRVLFGELSVDGKPIASTCNLVSGDTLFAFKIGWDPAFAPGSPGAWSEIKLLEQIPLRAPMIRRVDSCAHGDSYLASLYRNSVRTGVIDCIWSKHADVLDSVRRGARDLVRRLGRMAASSPMGRRDSETRG
jgi:CelD/BcsL family acetyltransferase involved in cellulose biosynthesis